MKSRKQWLSNEDYDFIYTSVPRICIDIIIINPDREILLVKRESEPYKGKWHLPGGRIRFRESIHKCINRIVKTEIGIKIQIGKMIGFMEFPRESQNKLPRHSISLVFLGFPLKKQCFKENKKIKFIKELPRTMLSIHKKFLENNLDKY